MPIYFILAESDRAFLQYFVGTILRVFECDIDDVDKILRSPEVVKIQAELQSRGSYIQPYIFHREPQNPLHEISAR